MQNEREETEDILPFGDINRETLDARDDISYATLAVPGVSEQVVRQISASFSEPEWMLELRLASLAKYQSMPVPTWGADLSALNLESIYYFAKPEGVSDAKTWDQVPEKIKNTFDRLGIPEAERTILA